MLGLGLSLAAGASWAAPPVNDAFAAATAVAGAVGTTTGTNLFASLEPSEPTPTVVAHVSQSVWYDWTSPYDGTWFFDTFGSSFDTVLAVYAGNDITSLTEIISNDDTAGFNSRVTLAATSGTVYRVQLSAFGTLNPEGIPAGPHRLSWSDCSVAPSAPSNPVPADGAPRRLLIDFSWDDVPGASEYGFELDGVFQTSTTQPTRDISGAFPLTDGFHTWRVSAFGLCGVSEGTTWTFSNCTDIPGTPKSPVPTDGGAAPCGVPQLEWSDSFPSDGGAPASDFDVYLDGVLTATVTSAFAPVGTLAPGSFHTWQVVAKSATCDPTTGPVWSFCVIDSPTILTPVSGTTLDCSAPLEISWTAACGAIDYEILIDGTPVGTTTGLSLTVNGPFGGGIRQVQVFGRSALCSGGPSAPTEPCFLDIPSGPSPADFAVYAPVRDPILDWADTCGAISYEVSVDGGAPIQTLAGASELDLSFVTLAAGCTHTWQVTASGDCGTTVGPLWTFTFDDSPRAPSPAVGESVDCGPLFAVWSVNPGSTTHTVYLDGAFYQETASPSVVLQIDTTTPLAAGPHTWQVVSSTSECGITTGPVWPFCVFGTPELGPPAVVDGFSYVPCGDLLFTWKHDCGAVAGFTLYVDGAPVITTTSKSYLLAGGLPLGPHDFRVAATGSVCGQTTSGLGTFCVTGGASTPVPFDGETTDAASLTRLSWIPTCGATTFTISIDGGPLIPVNPGDTFYDLPGRLSGCLHSWRVYSLGPCGLVGGPLWRFRLSDPPVAISPLPGDTFPCGPTTGFWSGSASVSEWTVYLDGAFLTTTTAANVVLEAAPGVGLPAGPHTWQVVGIDPGCGNTVTTGPVWPFCVTADAIGRSPSPDVVETTSCSNVLFNWSSDCATSTTVFGVWVDDVLVASTMGTTEVLVAGPFSGGLHRFYISARGDCGPETSASEWRFCTQEAATPLSPADGATTDCDSPLAFSWAPACGALSYRLEVGDGSTTQSFSTTATDFVKPPIGAAACDWFWRVISEGDCGDIAGEVRRFATLASVSDLVPSDGSTVSCGETVASWRSACGSTSYTVTVNGVDFATASSFLDLTASAVPGVNTVAVRTESACGAGSKTSTTFCRANAPSGGESPADGETTACSLSTLAWAPSCGADSYRVFLDGSEIGFTSSPAVLLTTAPLSGNHRWQVFTVSACGDELPGPDWMFCLQDAVTVALTPADGSTTHCTGDVLFSWPPVCGATGYDIVIDGVDTVVGPGTTFTASNLGPGSHTWFVESVGACGEVIGPVFTFCAQDSPALRIPAAGAVLDAGLPVSFGWDAACNATTYTLVVDGVTIASTTGTATVAQALFAPGTYVWSITASGGCGDTTSTTSSFCLANPPGPVLSPADGAPFAYGFIDFAWAPLAGATTYSLVIDGVEYDAGTSTALSVDVTTGSGHTVFVRAYGPCGAFDGPPSRFCTLAPSVPVSPAGGAIVDPLNPIFFDWTDGDIGVTSYTLVLDGTPAADTAGATNSQVTLPGPFGAGVRTWYVLSNGGCGPVAGPSTTFTGCLLGTAANPLPADNETTSCALAALDWDDVPGATGYRVQLNGAPYAVTMASNTAITSSAPPADGTPVRWQVFATGACGESTGPVWRFCRMDSPTTPIEPFDTETTDCGVARLTWTPVCGAAAYRVRLTGSAADVSTVTAAGSSVDLAPPLGPGAFEWSVTALSACGAETTGTTWTFCSLGKPTGPLSPALGQLLDCGSARFSWGTACGAASYEVFLDGASIGLTSSTLLGFPGPLAPGPHSWQVFSLGATCGSVAGPVWDFCAQGTPVPVSPATGETTGCSGVRFEWTPGCGSTGYTMTLTGPVGTTTYFATANSLLVTANLAAGPYSWSVTNSGLCGATVSTTDTFTVDCVPPTAITGPLPFDGETTATSLNRLEWDPVPCATGYRIDVTGPGLTVSNVAVANPRYFLPGVPNCGNYVWRVRALTPCGAVGSPDWRFTICDRATPPALFSPIAGETTASFPIFFDWADVPGAVAYRVAIDIDAFQVGDFTASQATLAISLSPGPHRYKVLVRTCCETTETAWRDFCVLDVPFNPNPDNATTICTARPRLSWATIGGALRYDVYIDGTLAGTGLTSPFFDVPFALADGTHTWQVIAFSVCGLQPGPVWTFNIGRQEPRRDVWFTNGVVYAVAVEGSTAYIGGSFSRVVSPNGTENQTRNNLAAIDLVTGRPLPWTPETDGPVLAVAVDGARGVFVGGDFQRLNGVLRPYAGLVDSPTSGGGTGATIAGWDPRPDGVVEAIALAAGPDPVYLGGRFEAVNGVARRYAAAVTKDAGVLLPLWTPALNFHVKAIAPTATGVFLGGTFSTPRPGAVKVSTVDGSTLAWDGGFDRYVYTFAFPSSGTAIYVGGLFDTAGGAVRHNIAVLDSNTGGAFSWNPNANGAITALAPWQNRIMTAGLFSSVGPAPRPYLAGVDPLTALVPDCGFFPDNPVRALATSGPYLLVGGDFTFMGFLPMRGFAVFGGNEFAPGNATRPGWELYE